MDPLLFSELVKQNVLFDSHCHLNTEQFDHDRDEVVERAENAGVKAIIDMGIDIESSKKAVENTEKYEIVYAAVGIDPEIFIPGSELFDKIVFELNEEDFEKWLEKTYEELKQLAGNKKVIMIGETGMDNYWLEKNEKLSPELKERSLKRQELLFRIHCKLSNELGKPLSVHSRNAIEQCLKILKEEKVAPKMAVFHSLTPDIGDDQNSFKNKVSKILQNSFYIGINGIITFNSASLLRDTYKSVLKESRVRFTRGNHYNAGFVLETDAPFLSPEPFRGKRNEPANIVNNF